MKIIIAGAGKVGTTLTKALSADGHDITLIDNDRETTTGRRSLLPVSFTTSWEWRATVPRLRF